MTEQTTTTSTSDGRFDPIVLIDLRSTSALPYSGPAAVLLGTLLAFQFANVTHLTQADTYTNSSVQLTTAVRANLFDDLLEFHQRLASKQQDLPDEAARLLRENLWQLYD